jgi:hypothetical protein
MRGPMPGNQFGGVTGLAGNHLRTMKENAVADRLYDYWSKSTTSRPVLRPRIAPTGGHLNAWTCDD